MASRASRFTVGSCLLAALAFLGCTWLVLDTSALDHLDAWRPWILRRDTTASEVARAIAVVTWPGVQVAVMTVIAWWAWQRRLRRLAWALVIAPTTAWGLTGLVKQAVHRPRPEHAYGDLFTAWGWSYPSTHVVLTTVSAIMVGALVTTTRQPRGSQLAWRVAGVALVAVVALDRWLLGVHWFSDLVGGLLLGIALAAATLWGVGVRMLPAWAAPHRGPTDEPTKRRAAVIYNPAKVADEAMLRRMVGDEVASRGWGPTLWLNTERDDPGYAMAQEAIRAGVDLVLCAGGDGTVRVVSSELANTGIPLALIPAGTANLLARNLGIPHDDDAAITLAFVGRPAAIDLVHVVVDGDARRGEHFVVMGGLGIDGKVMADTSVSLKRTVKSVAYAVAIAQNLNHAPVPAVVELDGDLVSDSPASLMLLGNVGEIHAGLQLFPRAKADDGQLDLLVTGPKGLGDWVRWGVGVLIKRGHKVTTGHGRRVRITVSEPLPYQLDGDTLGEATVFEATVVPGALTLMLPH